MVADLPHDLINEVLLRLPVKSLFRFRSVCKSWYETTNGRDFIYSHLHTSSINRRNRKLISKHPNYDDNHTRICALDINNGYQEEFPLNINHSPFMVHLGGAAYCNGLLLFTSSYNSKISIWNPSTRQAKEIPAFPPEYHRNHIGNHMYRFGYDATTDDYKVILLLGYKLRFSARYNEFLITSSSFKIWIFGLKSSCWRRILDFPYIDYDVVCRGGNYFIDDCLHFLCKREGSYIIVAFDVAKETFSLVPLPTVYQRVDKENPPYLKTFEGCISIVFSNQDLYVRKKEGIEFTWTKLFSLSSVIRTRRRFMPLGYSNEGDKILFLDGIRIYSYNLKESRLQETEMEDIGGGNSILCTESLVSVCMT